MKIEFSKRHGGMIDGIRVAWFEKVGRGHYQIRTDASASPCYGSEREAVSATFTKFMRIVEFKFMRIVEFKVKP
jgi:hypothetical protein